MQEYFATFFFGENCCGEDEITRGHEISVVTCSFSCRFQIKLPKPFYQGSSAFHSDCLKMKHETVLESDPVLESALEDL